MEEARHLETRRIAEEAHPPQAHSPVKEAAFGRHAVRRSEQFDERGFDAHHLVTPFALLDFRHLTMEHRPSPLRRHRDVILAITRDDAARLVVPSDEHLLVLNE